MGYFVAIDYSYLKVIPKGRPTMVSPQASSYFNPGIQVALRGMLADSARVQMSAVGRCEQHENFVKKHQWFTQRRLLKFLFRVLIWCQAQAPLQYSMQKYNQLYVCSFHGLDSSDQYLQRLSLSLLLFVLLQYFWCFARFGTICTI